MISILKNSVIIRWNLLLLAIGFIILCLSVARGEEGCSTYTDPETGNLVEQCTANAPGADGLPATSSSEYTPPIPSDCNFQEVAGETRQICNIFEAEQVVYEREGCFKASQEEIERDVCRVHNSNLWGVVGLSDIYVDEFLALVSEVDPLKDLPRADNGCVAGPWLDGAVVCPDYAATPWITASSSSSKTAKLCNHGPFQDGDGSGRPPSSPVSVDLSGETFHGCVQLWYPHANIVHGDDTPGLFIPWKELDFPSLITFIEDNGAGDGDWCIEAPPRWSAQTSEIELTSDEAENNWGESDEYQICVGKPCTGTADADICIPGEEKGKKPTDPNPNPKPQAPEWSKPQHVAGDTDVSCDSDAKYLSTRPPLPYEFQSGENQNQQGYSFNLLIRDGYATKVVKDSFILHELTGRQCATPGSVRTDRIIVSSSEGDFWIVDGYLRDGISCGQRRYENEDEEPENYYTDFYIVLKSTCESTES